MMGIGLHCLLTDVPLCRSILSSLLHHYSRNVQWTVIGVGVQCTVNKECSCPFNICPSLLQIGFL